MPDRLSAFDTSLLYLEDATNPLHVGSVAVFRRPRSGFDYDKLVDLVERRLALVPRYRQRVAPVPGHLARPVWVDDENFDIAYHVRRSALPRPGSQAQLTDLVARLMSRRLDQGRPLWEAYLVEGLAGNRIAIITKTHNALVDGVDAIEIGQAILDPGPREPADGGWLWMPRPAPGAARLLADAAREVAHSPAVLLDNARAALGDVAATAQRVGRVAEQALDTLGGVLRVTAHPAPDSPLNVRISGQRRFAVARTDLATCHAIGDAHGCTVNDVVLAAVAGALRGWLVHRGDQPGTGSSVRALVPLSMAGGAEAAGVQPYLVDLPVGEPDPVLRLQHVRHQLRVHAESGRSVAADVLARAGGAAAPTLHALGARSVTGFARRVFNLVVSGVPGPQAPLYAAGARMTEMFPVVPLARNQALSVGVSSYDGRVYYGLNADRDAVADVDTVGRMIEEATGELGELVTG